MVLGLVVASLLAETGTGRGFVMAAQLKTEGQEQQAVTSGQQGASDQATILGTK